MDPAQITETLQQLLIQIGLSLGATLAFVLWLFSRRK